MQRGQRQSAAGFIPFTHPFLVLVRAGVSAALVSRQNARALVLHVANGVMARDGLAVRLTPALVDVVIGVFGNRCAVSKVELIDALLSDRDDGGPLTDVIGVRLFHLRPALARLGLGIITLRNGWLLAGQASEPSAAGTVTRTGYVVGYRPASPSRTEAAPC